MNSFSLNDICYEHIIDQYYYGLYGDFKLVIDRNTGCFNATKLCKQGGKLISNWLRNKDTKELIEYYQSTNEFANFKNQYFYEIHGNKNELYNTVVSGTYLPKQLILGIALWISKVFYAKVSKIVDAYFGNEFVKEYKHDNEKLQDRLLTQELEMKKVKLQNGKLMRQVKKYKQYEEDITFKTENKKKLHTFTLIRKNDPDSSLSLYVIRVQRVKLQQTLTKLRRKYPNMEILWGFSYYPNSINLYNRIKETVQNIRFHANDIRLENGFTEDQFIEEIKTIAAPIVHVADNSSDIDSDDDMDCDDYMDCDVNIDSHTAI